jgi:tRNA dimethylallyltransferase
VNKSLENKILIISGATASGKSSLAFEIAKRQNSVIINADAMQIYQGLPILSAQPDIIFQNQVQHFLYSYLSPFEKGSVALWLDCAVKIIKQALNEGKLPIVVGGSGMYIDKLINGISLVPEIDGMINEGANNLFYKLGKDNFLENLILMGDADASNVLDKQRLIRRYEVLLQTGKSLSFWQSNDINKFFADSQFLHFNLNLSKPEVYKNCNDRFLLMIKSGAIEEVERFFDIYRDVVFSQKLPIIKTLGFNEIACFLGLDGYQKIDYNKMVELASQKTRNYAKRQITWFKNQKLQQIFFDSTPLSMEYFLGLL